MRWKPLVYKGKNLGDRFLISDWCGLNEKGGSIREYFINSNRKYAGKDPISGEKLRWEIVG